MRVFSLLFSSFFVAFILFLDATAAGSGLHDRSECQWRRVADEPATFHVSKRAFLGKANFEFAEITAGRYMLRRCLALHARGIG